MALLMYLPDNDATVVVLEQLAADDIEAAQRDVLNS